MIHRETRELILVRRLQVLVQCVAICHPPVHTLPFAARIPTSAEGKCFDDMKQHLDVHAHQRRHLF